MKNRHCRKASLPENDFADGPDEVCGCRVEYTKNRDQSCKEEKLLKVICEKKVLGPMVISY